MLDERSERGWARCASEASRGRGVKASAARSERQACVGMRSELPARGLAVADEGSGLRLMFIQSVATFAALINI